MKIKVIDCTDPKSCIECIKTCPMNIFVLKPVGTEKLSDAVEKWKIKAIFKDFCNGCMKCVDVCPEECISIKF